MTTHQLKLLGITLILAAGLAACDKPGPAESAGKSIDQAASDLSKKAGETADKVEKKVSDAGSKTANVIEDSEITAQVKAAIFGEPGLDSLKITVDTVGGIVTLGGSVDSASHSDRVRTLAAGVSGVKDVVNHLVTTSK